MTEQQPKEYIITETELEYIQLNSVCLPELYEEIRSRPAPSPEGNKISLAEMPTLHDKERYMQGYREGKAKARSDVLDKFSGMEKMHIDGVSYPDLYNEFIRIYKSLRHEAHK